MFIKMFQICLLFGHKDISNFLGVSNYFFFLYYLLFFKILDLPSLGPLGKGLIGPVEEPALDLDTVTFIQCQFSQVSHTHKMVQKFVFLTHHTCDVILAFQCP